MKGFVNINKPLGMTSSDVVVKVRGILRRASGEKQKVGHLGTLDPQGSGVLPIAVGTATRLFDFMQEKTKVYQATFVFGKETDTLDGVGKVVETSDILPTKEQIEAFVATYHGKIDQIPPQYSAKSVDGKRAYDLAREGKTINLTPKRVNIIYVKLIEAVDGIAHLANGNYALSENEYAFEIACSSGTYIRSIVRDLAALCGTVGTMTDLIRTKSGVFEIENSVKVEDFISEEDKEGLLIAPENVVNYPEIRLTEKEATRLYNGLYDEFPFGDGVYKVFAPDGFYGIGEVNGGKIKVKAYIRS